MKCQLCRANADESDPRNIDDVPLCHYCVVRLGDPGSPDYNPALLDPTYYKTRNTQ